MKEVWREEELTFVQYDNWLMAHLRYRTKKSIFNNKFYFQRLKQLLLIPVMDGAINAAILLPQF
jgi:hypothetical protein